MSRGPAPRDPAPLSPAATKEGFASGGLGSYLAVREQKAAESARPPGAIGAVEHVRVSRGAWHGILRAPGFALGRGRPRGRRPFAAGALLYEAVA